MPELDRAVEERIACRFYTHARRHPIVIGNIQGLRIPPVTPAQLGLTVGSLIGLVMTRPIWAHLGPAANGFVLVLVPVGLAWVVRSVRMEGRAPWRAGRGLLRLLAAPRTGVCLGRRDRPMRPVRYRGRVWVIELGAVKEHPGRAVGRQTRPGPGRAVGEVQ